MRLLSAQKMIKVAPFTVRLQREVGGGGSPYHGLYGEAPQERGTFFRLQVYIRVGISQVEVYKRVGKSAI